MSQEMDWGQRLVRLQDGKDKEHANAAIQDAARWHTCSVGKEIDLRANEIPVDEQLQQLGHDFEAAMLAHDWARALKLHWEIQDYARSGDADLRPVRPEY